METLKLYLLSCLCILCSFTALTARSQAQPLNKDKTTALKKENLYGYWSLDGVAWLKITKGRIFFVDEDGLPSVRYSLKKDTLTWYFDGTEPQKEVIRIVNDTLLMKNEAGEASYVRVRH